MLKVLKLFRSNAIHSEEGKVFSLLRNFLKSLTKNLYEEGKEKENRKAQILEKVSSKDKEIQSKYNRNNNNNNNNGNLRT